MRRALFGILVLVLAACGGDGITPPPNEPALDPWLTVRVRDMLDPNTAVGKTQWHVFALLTGPYDSQNGIAFQGTIDAEDVRLGHNVRCVTLGADSVGQRFLTILAIGDTTTGSATLDADARQIVNAWYAGNHVLPAGWMALTFEPRDAFVSAQFDAGHGLVPHDPIKWGFDWTANGTTSFYERTDSDVECSSFL